MKLKNFVVEPCKSRLALEFLPKKKESLDLKQIASALKNGGVTVEVETPFLLISRLGSHSLTLFKSGKIIVKDTKLESEARELVQALINKINAVP